MLYSFLFTFIQSFNSDRTCQSPGAMSNEELKATLVIAGKSTKGSRVALQKRLKESDDGDSNVKCSLPSKLNYLI